MRRDALEGFRDAFLFIPIYLPISVPFAISAQALGVAEWQVVLWSTLLFAGSAQLACLGALAAGAGVVELLVITFMANIRHSFVAMTLAPHYARVPPRLLPLYAFTSSVGAMAVVPRRAREGRDVLAYGIATQVTQWGLWVGFTALGLVAGPLLPERWGPVLAFAAAAGFIGLLNGLVREEARGGLAAVLVAATLGLVLTLWWPPQAAAIAGAIAGSFAAVLVPERRKGPDGG